MKLMVRIALGLCGLAIFATASYAQVILPQTGDKGFIRVCNGSSEAATLERITPLEAYSLGTLASGNCYFDEMSRDDLEVSIFVLKGSSVFEVIEAEVADPPPGIDWEKILYLFLGAIIGTVSGLVRWLVSPITSHIASRSLVSGFKKRLLLDLKSAGVGIDMHPDIIKLLTGQGQAFATNAVLSEAKLIDQTYRQVKSGEITNVEAISALGGSA